MQPRFALYALWLALAACGAPTEKSTTRTPSEEIGADVSRHTADLAVAAEAASSEKAFTVTVSDNGIRQHPLVVQHEEKRTTIFRQRDANDEGAFKFKMPQETFDSAQGQLYVDGVERGGRFKVTAKAGELFTHKIGTGRGRSVKVFMYSQGKYVARAVSESLVVGDIFLVAGQSNSTNAGDGSTSSKTGGAFMFTGSNWQVARDPFLTADYSRGSSAWPSFGDFYFERTNVPVGVVSLGWSATSVDQWQPGNASGLYARLESYAKAFGRKGFRAVLWHQGESDVFLGTRDWVYRSYMQNLIGSIRNAVGWQELPWVVARTSYPGVAGWYSMCDYLGGYSKCGAKITDYQQNVIRGQNTTITGTGNVFPGPNTDTLWENKYRAYQGNSYIHFNASGQVEHGKLWNDAVKALPRIK
jgi:hypothetical protein